MDTGNGTGSITLMPGFSDAGTVSVTFTATHAGTSPLTASQDITVTVTNVNRPLVLTNPGDQSHAEGEAIVLQIVATDPDGDPLTFSATGLPTGLSINAATGRITGTIASGAAVGSPYSSVVTVTDGITPPVSTDFSWTVQTPPSPCPPNTVCFVSNYLLAL